MTAQGYRGDCFADTFNTETEDTTMSNVQSAVESGDSELKGCQGTRGPAEKLRPAVTPDEVMSSACALSAFDICLINDGMDELKEILKHHQGGALFVHLMWKDEMISLGLEQSPLVQAVVRGHTRKVMKQLLEEAGWEVTEVRRWLWPSVSHVVWPWWRSCWRIRPSLDYVMKTTTQLVNERGG